MLGNLAIHHEIYFTRKLADLAHDNLATDKILNMSI